MPSSISSTSSSGGGANETIRLDIVINTRAAIEQIRAMTGETESLDKAIRNFGDYIVNKSKQWGVPISQLREQFMALDDELKGIAKAQGGGSLFGKLGDESDKFDQWVGKYIEARHQASGFRVDNEGVVTSINHITTSAQKLANVMTQMRAGVAMSALGGKGAKGFEDQLAGINQYGSKLKFVQSTIKTIAQETGASFQQVGAAISKSFPSVQNTNLIRDAVANLKTETRALSESFRTAASMAKLLDAEISKLQKPARNAKGQFVGGTDFASQLKGMSTYEDKLKLIQTTISNISTATGASFQQVGAALSKAFPSIQNTNLVSDAITNLKNQTRGLGDSFKSTAAMADILNKKLIEMKAAGKLNLTGDKNTQINQLKEIIRGVSKDTGAQYKDVANALERVGIPSAQANAAVKGLNFELTKGTRAAQGFSHGIDVIRTALGTLTAVFIFGALTAITDFFKGAIDQAKQFEETLYRIGNAERQLSQAGLDVTVKGLREGIDDIQKALPIFSKEDIAQLIGSLATTTKELGFTEDQILKLGAAVAILNVNSTETESVLQTQAKVTNALISPQARSVGSLGLAFGKLKMEAKAAELGINKSLEEMSDAEKTEVKFRIVIETAGLENIDDISALREEIQKGGGDFEALNDYLNSNTARLAANGAAWKDLQTTVGQVFLPFIPAVTKTIDFLSNAFNGLKVAIIETVSGIGTTIQLFKDILNAPLDTDFIDLIINGGKKINDELRKGLVNQFFPGGIPESASAGIKALYEPLINPPRETFTGAQSVQEETAKIEEAYKGSEEKIQDIMSDARDKREQIDENYRRKIEDANRDHAQKMADIARDVERKQEDALRGNNEKVEDINRDADEKVAEANQDVRDKELEREAEYQNRLRELREKFLFDLEDALRERDARQVLRLIREYNRDKKNLEERRKLDKQDDKKDLAQKLADIERDRQLKLEAARRELAEKQAEIALWAERERADAQLALSRKLADARQWHQRELQEYQQYLKRKLEELAKAIVKEYQLTEAGAKAIYNLLNGYFGSSGSISNLLQSGLAANLSSIVSSGSGGGLASPTWAQGGFYGAAEGGTFVATRPTKVMFGEHGPEVATFTPIGRTGSDVGKVFGEGSQAQNSLELRIGLSSGLIAEIVDTSLENVAATIEKIGREK